jgi:hypothetical protein
MPGIAYAKRRGKLPDLPFLRILGRNYLMTGVTRSDLRK